jgi:hypothetical protein
MLINKFVKKYTKLYINLQISASPSNLRGVGEIAPACQGVLGVGGANHIRVRRHVGADGRC